MNKKIISIVVFIAIAVSALWDVIEKDMQLSMVSSPTLEALVENLRVYRVYDENGDLKLLRLGRNNDGGYVVPVKALEQADVLLGYGINDDSSFEDQFSMTYNKPSYGFDCGIQQVSSNSPLFTLISECISSNQFLYGEKKIDQKITSFEDQIARLNLKDKKVFIKMDIEGAEYQAFPDILKHHANVTGIVVEIHLNIQDGVKKGLELLNGLNENFVLVHVHGNNNAGANIKTSKSINPVPNVLELTFVNKSLLLGFVLADDQSHPQKIDQSNDKNHPDLRFEILK